MLRAVVSYAPSGEAPEAKINSKVHRTLPEVLGQSALPPRPPTNRWDIPATNAYVNSIFAQYTSTVGPGRVAWCMISLPSMMSSTIKVIIDLDVGTEDYGWPLRLEETSRLWGDVLATGMRVGTEILATLTDPPPTAATVELHAEVAPFMPERPPLHDQLNDAVDLTFLGRSSGQPVRQGMWAGWAENVFGRPPLETIVLAWAEMCPDWGYIDPDAAIALLANRLGVTPPA